MTDRTIEGATGPAQLVGGTTGGVRQLLRLEGALVLAAAVLAYGQTGDGLGRFLLLFLLPDLSMLGYLVNRRIGAICYNIGHSYLLPAALALLAFRLGQGGLWGPILIWFAHIGFDRMLGYGLKYATAFGDTHLGRVGRLRPGQPLFKRQGSVFRP